MKLVENMLIRMAGYAPSTVEADSQEEREPLMKLGWSVVLAVLVAASNWATAGWVYSEGALTPIRIAVSTVGAVLGGAIVLVFDRGFIYFADTSIAKGGATVIAYAASRICLILLVSSITAQAVIPIIMGKELAAHALYMTEQSEAERMSKLNTQYDLGSKKATVEAATSEVKKLEKAVSMIPPDIQQMLLTARSCWAEYTARRSELLSGGLSEAQGREQLIWKASECDRESKAANAEKGAYVTRTRAELNAAVAFNAQAGTQFSDANAIINGKIERARVIEASAITPRSSTVLYSMLRSDPGALMKWAVVSLTLLFLELFPLIQKFQAGQSSIGRRIATDRAIRRLQSDEHLAKAEHDAVVADAITEASKLAVADAMANPEVRATFAQVFAANIAAYAPTQAVQSMMHEFSTRQYDVNQFMHRFPRYASVIAQAWSKAIHETAEILNRGIGGGPTQGDGQPI
jgi:hypothetical protein